MPATNHNLGLGKARAAPVAAERVPGRKAMVAKAGRRKAIGAKPWSLWWPKGLQPPRSQQKRRLPPKERSLLFKPKCAYSTKIG